VRLFETRLRTAADIQAWFDGIHPVVESKRTPNDRLWSDVTYRPSLLQRHREASLYVAREARGRGAGRPALAALIAAADKPDSEAPSRIFVENQPSRLLFKPGFREVGVYESTAGSMRLARCGHRRTLIPKNLR